MTFSSAAYPPDLSEPELDNLASIAGDWSIANGLAVRIPSHQLPDEHLGRITAIHVPVTLFPSLFPRRCFEFAIFVQDSYNRLYAAVSRDEDFLAHVVREVADGDEFIANLWKTHLRVKAEGYSQSLSLGLFRSDYMVHQDGEHPDQEPQLKQVEFNTISSSFGGLASVTSGLHRYLSKFQYPGLAEPVRIDDPHALPVNEAVRSLAVGLRDAYRFYRVSEPGNRSCILFITQEGEKNVFDQRHLEYSLQAQGITVFRLPLSRVLAETTVADTAQKPLLYRPQSNPSALFEVAVAYFRSGYGPLDYPDQSGWEARYQIERSAAIKCPTVLTQLAGAKKVQQLLATPDEASRGPFVLGRFISEDSHLGSGEAAQLRKTFANIFPMDTSPAGLEARRRALDPDLCRLYVLKPQREGGGNNIYRDAIPAFLRSMPESHWPSFILMELITPPPGRNIILRAGKTESGGVICELGIYGICLWDHETGSVIHSRDAGYLLRTKGDQSEEGGVAAGYGCMDSCLLV